MSTAMFGVIQSIPDRVGELRLLTGQAKETQESDEALYNALCRSCAVLIASHLEAYLKEISKALLIDLNYYLGGFDRQPPALKRAFCRKIAFYEGVPNAQIEGRIKQLMAFFDKNSVEIDLHAFTYKETPNKNPSESSMDSMFEKFGLAGVVDALSPILDPLFDNDTQTDITLVRRLKRARAKLFNFPYAPLPDDFCFLPRKRSKDAQSIWTDFVKTIMDRRHTIAHGDTLSNPTSWEELDRDVEKLSALFHGIAFSACAGVTAKSA
jgi:hypothetical protein